jgi:hypothetical protein
MSLDPSSIPDLFKFGAVMSVKIGLLILILLYTIFALMLGTKIRSLNRTIFLPFESGEAAIRIFAILYFFAVLSLFIATLVIV